MAEPRDDMNVLLERALAGDETDLAALFDGYRERLRRMIRLRMDRRLSGRVDSSDVLQEAYLDVRKRLSEYRRNPTAMPCHPISGSGSLVSTSRLPANAIFERCDGSRRSCRRSLD
jgi:hypothetical protein